MAIEDITGRGRTEEQLLQEMEQLKKGGQPPTGGGMEQRVAALEAKVANVEKGVESLDARLRGVETGVAEIRGKLDDMPTKDWMTTRLIVIVGAIVGLATLFLRAFPTGTP
jgi:hypothetical protein